jgi:hypothetical protein
MFVSSSSRMAFQIVMPLGTFAAATIQWLLPKPATDTMKRPWPEVPKLR